MVYEVGNFVEMKKPHACRVKSTGKHANHWEVLRIGADIKLRCTNCQREIEMSRWEFDRKVKKVL